MSIDLATLGIWSARRGLAGIGNNLRRWCGWQRQTLSEGITRHAGGAVTHGHMLMHLTNGIRATCARTRIHTLLTHTGQVLSAFRVQDALGTAAQCRITKVTW